MELGRFVRMGPVHSCGPGDGALLSRVADAGSSLPGSVVLAGMMGRMVEMGFDSPRPSIINRLLFIIMCKYVIYDSTDHRVGGVFKSFSEAIGFKRSYGNDGWCVSEVSLRRPPSERQLRGLEFIERELGVKYGGELDDRDGVSLFLGEYLELAREHEREIRDGYNAAFWL